MRKNKKTSQQPARISLSGDVLRAVRGGGNISSGTVEDKSTPDLFIRSRAR